MKFHSNLAVLCLLVSTCAYSKQSSYSPCLEVLREADGVVAAGGSGIITLGESSDGNPLAIKRSSSGGTGRLRYEGNRLETLAEHDPTGVFVRGRFDPAVQAVVTEVPPGAITLEQWMNHSSTIPSPEKLELIVRQLEEVHAVLSRAEIIHGDLVSRNILITPEGRIKVIDLGGGPYRDDLSSLQVLASELDMHSQDLPSRFTDHHRGSPASPEALSFLKLSSDTQVNLLGKGGEGSVYRVVAPDGNSEVVKVYELSPGFNPATMKLVKNPEEKLAVKRQLFNQTTSTLKELNAHPELATGPMKIIQLREVYEDAFSYRMSDTRGYTLHDISEKPLNASEQREYAATYEKGTASFLKRMRKLGWETSRLSIRDTKIGEFMMPGFEITKGNVRFSIAASNVVIHPITKELTLIDLE